MSASSRGDVILNGSVYSVAFNPESELLAVSGGDGTVRLWSAALFTSPYLVRCNEVGQLGAADWNTYASGETEPSACGSTP